MKVGTLGKEEAPFHYKEPKIRRKLKNPKFISRSPQEHFQLFLRHQNLKLSFGLWANSFRQSHQNCIPRVRKDILLRTISSGKSNFMNFIWHWAYSFWILNKKFPARLSKLLLLVQKTFWEKKILKSYKLLVLGTMSVKFLDFEGKIFCRVVKIAFCVSRKTFWRKTFFWKKLNFC